VVYFCWKIKWKFFSVSLLQFMLLVSVRYKNLMPVLRFPWQYSWEVCFLGDITLHQWTRGFLCSNRKQCFHVQGSIVTTRPPTFEDEGTMFQGNIRNYLPSDRTPYPRKESQITYKEQWLEARVADIIILAERHMLASLQSHMVCTLLSRVVNCDHVF
jgi:hypothetical protein